jgi:hypothetical protein
MNYTVVEVVCCVYRTRCTPWVQRSVYNNSQRTVRKDPVRKNIDGLRKMCTVWAATYNMLYLLFLKQRMSEHILAVLQFIAIRKW